MTDWTTARVTPEMQAELRRLLDAPPQHLTIVRDDALALLDAAAERDRLAEAVERVRELHAPYYPLRDGRAYCGVCEGDELIAYPCPTIRALDAETGGDRAMRFSPPQAPRGHMVGGLITDGHAGQRLALDAETGGES